jgi:hypothetical protein
MLYFNFNADGKVSEVLDKYRPPAICRSDFKSFEQAEFIARQANALNDGHHYTATDSGPNCYPRYDVIRVPQVGDEVSMAFNGDYYPVGTITRVSGKCGRIVTTSEGKRFYRRRLSGVWLYSGMWALVGGHRNERNPSF